MDPVGAHRPLRRGVVAGPAPSRRAPRATWHHVLVNLGEPEIDAAGNAILAAGAALVRDSAEALADLAPGVNLTDLRALSLLAEEGPKRLVDIAYHLDVTPTTATRLADRLVEQALVERSRHSGDRREVYLSVSVSGERLVRRIVEQRRKLVGAALDGLPERERAAVAEVLRRVADPAQSREADPERSGRAEIA